MAIDLSKYKLTEQQQAQQTSGVDLSKYKTSSSTDTQPQGNWFTNAASAIGNFGLGIAKGVANQTLGVGKVLAGGIGTGLAATKIPGVSQYGQSVVNNIKNPNQLTQGIENAVKPQGMAQNIGSTVGSTGASVGEFFIPGGVEASTFAKGAEYIDKLPDAIGLTGKAAEAVAGALKIALRSGISGTSMAGVTAAQGGNAGQIKGAGEIGAVFGGLGQAIETFGKGLSQVLQKSDFRLSPVAEAKAINKVNSAAKFMTDNNILGTEETKFSKLTKINTDMENALQSSLPKNIQISKQAVIDNINSSIESFKKSDPAIYKAAKTDGDQAIALLKENPKLTVEDTLNAKRSYGKQAFNTSKFQVKDPTKVVEGQYAVEQGFQKALDDKLASTSSTIKLPENLQKLFVGKTEVPISDFNKVYSRTITSKNLTNLARFKKDSSLIGRLAGLWIGEIAGEAVVPGVGGKIGGAVIGEMASSRIPGALKYSAEHALAATPGQITGAAKVGLGLNPPNQ